MNSTRLNGHQAGSSRVLPPHHPDEFQRVMLNESAVGQQSGSVVRNPPVVGGVVPTVGAIPQQVNDLSSVRGSSGMGNAYFEKSGNAASAMSNSNQARQQMQQQQQQNPNVTGQQQFGGRAPYRGNSSGTMGNVVSYGNQSRPRFDDNRVSSSGQQQQMSGQQQQQQMTGRVQQQRSNNLVEHTMDSNSGPGVSQMNKGSVVGSNSSMLDSLSGNVAYGGYGASSSGGMGIPPTVTSDSAHQLLQQHVAGNANGRMTNMDYSHAMGADKAAYASAYAYATRASAAVPTQPPHHHVNEAALLNVPIVGDYLTGPTQTAFPPSSVASSAQATCASSSVSSASRMSIGDYASTAVNNLAANASPSSQHLQQQPNNRRLYSPQQQQQQTQQHHHHPHLGPGQQTVASSPSTALDQYTSAVAAGGYHSTSNFVVRDDPPSPVGTAGNVNTAGHVVDVSEEARRTASEVATAFVREYYRTMKFHPETLHLFYFSTAQLSCQVMQPSTSPQTQGKWKSFYGQGEDDIVETYAAILPLELPPGVTAEARNDGEPSIVRSKILTLESQPMADGGVMLQATGCILDVYGCERSFTQSAVLAVDAATGHYMIIHDMIAFGEPHLAKDETTITNVPQQPSTNAIPPQSNVATTSSMMMVAPVSSSQVASSTTVAETPATSNVVMSRSSVAEPNDELASQSVEQLLSNANEITSTTGGAPVPPLRPTPPSEDGASTSNLSSGEEHPAATASTAARSASNEKKQPTREAATTESVADLASSSTTTPPPVAPPTRPWKTLQQAPPSLVIDTTTEPAVGVPDQQSSNQHSSSSHAPSTASPPVVEPRKVLPQYGSTTYAGKLVSGPANGDAVAKVVGQVVKRQSDSKVAPLPREGENETVAKTLWVAHLSEFNDDQIKRAVLEQLKGKPVEGRVVNIERMKSGPAGFIELDSEACASALLAKPFCVRGVQIKIERARNLYPATPRNGRERSINKNRNVGTSSNEEPQQASRGMMNRSAAGGVQNGGVASSRTGNGSPASRGNNTSRGTVGRGGFSSRGGASASFTSSSSNRPPVSSSVF